MSCGVIEPFRHVMSLADDPSAACDDSSDRNFAFSFGQSCLTKGFLHVFFVIFHIHKGK